MTGAFEAVPTDTGLFAMNAVCHGRGDASSRFREASRFLLCSAHLTRTAYADGSPGKDGVYPDLPALLPQFW